MAQAQAQAQDQDQDLAPKVIPAPAPAQTTIIKFLRIDVPSTLFCGFTDIVVSSNSYITFGTGSTDSNSARGRGRRLVPASTCVAARCGGGRCGGASGALRGHPTHERRSRYSPHRLGGDPIREWQAPRPSAAARQDLRLQQ
eukprot:3271774-Rhodomonas_salina.3